jgi:hypothetical protein
MEPVEYNLLTLIGDIRRELTSISVSTIFTFAAGFPDTPKSIQMEEILSITKLICQISQGGKFDTIAPSTESTSVLRLVEDVGAKAKGHITRKGTLKTLLFANFFNACDNSFRVFYNETTRFTDNICTIDPNHFALRISDSKDLHFAKNRQAGKSNTVLESLSRLKNSRKKVFVVEFYGTRFRMDLNVTHILGSEVNTSRFIVSELLQSELGVATMRVKGDRLEIHIPVSTKVDFRLSKEFLVREGNKRMLIFCRRVVTSKWRYC